MKIRPVGAEVFHADGQTDMAKIIVAFRNFANLPKIYNLMSTIIGVWNLQAYRMRSTKFEDGALIEDEQFTNLWNNEHVLYHRNLQVP
jgi:hypothetical protein